MYFFLGKGEGCVWVTLHQATVIMHFSMTEETANPPAGLAEVWICVAFMLGAGLGSNLDTDFW